VAIEGNLRPCHLHRSWDATLEDSGQRTAAELEGCGINVTTLPGPSAESITVSQTLDLLDGPHAAFARGVVDGQYTLWLGSGISRDRLPDLGVLIKNVLSFVHDRLAPQGVDCPHRQALEQIVAMAGLRERERATFTIDDDPMDWPVLGEVINGLKHQYSEMLATEVDGEPSDYLLWEGVDVTATYGGPGKPDCEHLCIAILVLEGVVTDAVSANWDGLIEDAVAELTGDDDEVVKVVVLPGELRGVRRPLSMYKFHGCAVLAAQDPATYRPALVGTRPQITAWTSNPDVKPIRAKMISLATERPTLVVGLSTQDDDIQHLFADAKAVMTWPWPTVPPAHVFSADELGLDHLNILRVVYREYDAHSEDIRAQALVRAYGKPLLTALVLHLLTAKLQAYIGEVDAPQLSVGDRAELAAGIAVLARLAADAAEPDRLAFVRELVAAQRDALVQFRGEDRDPALSGIYRPLSTAPADRVHADPALATNGIRELAAALSMLGRGVLRGTWTLGRGSLTSGVQGVVKVSAAGGAEAAVFFAANGKAAARLISESDLNPDDDTVVLVHSTEPVAAPVRSPRTKYGRTGRSAMREVDMSSLLRDSADFTKLESSFQMAAAL